MAKNIKITKAYEYRTGKTWAVGTQLTVSDEKFEEIHQAKACVLIGGTKPLSSKAVKDYNKTKNED